MSQKEKAIGQAEMDLRQQGSRRVAGSTQKFLKHYAPFDKMKSDALQLLSLIHIYQLVDPGRPLKPESIPIPGITEDMVRGKPSIDLVLPAFHEFCADTVLIAHNAAFDMRFLQLKEKQTGVRFTQPVLDTLLLSAVVHPNQESHKLDDILGLSLIHI